MGKKLTFKKVLVKKIYSHSEYELDMERVHALTNLSENETLNYINNHFESNPEILNNCKIISRNEDLEEVIHSFIFDEKVLENEDGYDYGMERNEDVKGDLSEFEGSYAEDDVE